MVPRTLVLNRKGLTRLHLATYEGDLSFEGRVRVDGLFRGRIFTEEILEVGEEGRIEGEVDAKILVVAGMVDGTIRVRGAAAARAD